MPSNELKAKVTADTSDYDRKMSRLGATARSAARTVTMAITAATAATASLGLAALRTGAQYQLLLKRMQAVFGDAAGSRIFGELARSAQQSSLNTQELVESFIRFSALRGGEASLETIESIGYAAKTLKKDIGFVTEQFARMFNQMERGERVDKDLRDSLVGAFGPDGKEFMDKVAKGTVTAAQALELLNKRGREMARIYDQGIDAEISKIQGSWDNFLLQIGNDDNLEAVAELFETMREALDAIAASGAVRDMAESLNSMISGVSAEDIQKFMDSAMQIASFLSKTAQILVNNWKKAVGLLIAFRGIMVLIQVAQTAATIYSAMYNRQLISSHRLLVKHMATLTGINARLVQRLAGEKAINKEIAARPALQAADAAGAAGAAAASVGRTPPITTTGGNWATTTFGRTAGAGAAGGAAGALGVGIGTAVMAATVVAVLGSLAGYGIGSLIADAWEKGTTRTNYGKMDEAEAEAFRQKQRERVQDEAMRRLIANLPPGPPATA